MCPGYALRITVIHSGLASILGATIGVFDGNPTRSNQHGRNLRSFHTQKDSADRRCNPPASRPPLQTQDADDLCLQSVWWEFKGDFNDQGLFNSIAYGLNSAVRRAIAERIDMYFPEKLKRLLPQRFKVQQEQELAALFVEG
ncbi:hypothetical protein HPP92_016211 [Vanilla planifolia]|uniref:Uncharacterized protein n=1 Tax=Vanilla planifolia TaxID=51239 RepID=A0A835URX8_VANPL|nr:hypothetical protein HPP92_016211 [Vanilla planifolia]